VGVVEIEVKMFNRLPASHKAVRPLILVAVEYYVCGDFVAHGLASIVPQSVGMPIEVADRTLVDEVRPEARIREPIAAVFDAVPVQAHPLLAGRLAIDDPADLEASAVGTRVHGTAMASLALHGDLNDPPSPINRRLYFRPVMHAPEFGDEVFDNERLVVDVIVEAVMRMRANGGESVILVNLSLGDRTKPFAGKISTWARALDYPRLHLRHPLLGKRRERQRRHPNGRVR
jgi:hypothetical protein